ncbi:MAG: sensor histidine kinase, partial [Clostridia bacterium]
ETATRVQALPGEAFHPGGPDPAVLTTIPGHDPPAAVLAVTTPVLDPFTETVLASYAAHVGLVLTNAALLSRQAELGAVLERERLARELHDAISQRLFSSTLDLAALSEEIPRSLGVHALVESARTHTRAALQEMRELIYELSPPKAGPLGPLLRALAPHTGVSIQIESDPPLSEAVRMALLRIAQEAVQNALRHASGAHVRVVLREDVRTAGSVLTLVVEDEGQGFDIEQVTPGLGLAHMRERALSVGARLTIDTRPGAGCRVLVEAPRAGAAVDGGAP